MLLVHIKKISLWQKNPLIPPLVHNSQFVEDLKQRSELFNSFLPKQCTHIETWSNVATQILCRTSESYNTINFTEVDVENGIAGPLLKILTDFLKLQKQIVVPNDQHLSWSDVLAAVLVGSILGPLLSLIYINDLSDGLMIYLTKITKWAFQWKMSYFDSDISKQAHEIIFPRKKYILL